MTQAGKTPHFLWAKVINTTNYLVNQSPTRANLGTTPFEKFTSKALDLSHLKVFGSLAYVHVDKEEKKNWMQRPSKQHSLGMIQKQKALGVIVLCYRKSLCLEMSSLMSTNLVIE